MKKIIFIIISLFISVCIYSQHGIEHGNDHDHEHEFLLPENSLLFPQKETGYDWQCTDETKETSMWVGISISENPNKLGNYTYSVYMTSNTYNTNDQIIDILVGGIDILYYSHTRYLNERRDEKGLLQSKDNFKEQIAEELNTYENKEDLLEYVGDYNSVPLIITNESILIHTFFLPDRNSDIVVLWDYIKKLKK